MHTVLTLCYCAAHCTGSVLCCADVMGGMQGEDGGGGTHTAPDMRQTVVKLYRTVVKGNDRVVVYILLFLV